MTRLIDTHVHLSSAEFDTDREDVIDRALEAGVVRLLDVATDPATSLKAVALAQRCDRIWASVGIHPHDAALATQATLDSLEGLLCRPKVAAVGETGLDFYRRHCPADVQIASFRAHIRMAIRCRLPLIVHDRAAHAQTIGILEEEDAGQVGGVLHCFSGDGEMAARATSIGFCVAFGGSVTYAPTAAWDPAASVPMERVLLETDAPYLAPVPNRGRRNEPAYLRHTAEHLARIRGVSLEEVSEITTVNALSAFRW